MIDQLIVISNIHAAEHLPHVIWESHPKHQQAGFIVEVNAGSLLNDPLVNSHSARTPSANHVDDLVMKGWRVAPVLWPEHSQIRIAVQGPGALHLADAAPKSLDTFSVPFVAHSGPDVCWLNSYMWTHQGVDFEEPPENAVGFIYRIEQVSTGRYYIGKKILWNRVAKPPLKGKKRRRISQKPSDWKTYYGSSDELKELVTQNPADFKREVLRVCFSKSEMSYWETYEIMASHALIDPLSFNKWISARIQANTLTSMSTGTLV